MFNLVKNRKWFFLASTVAILIGIIALIVSGLNLGLDFKSGTTMTLVFSQPVAQDRLRSTLATLGYTDAVIQHSPKDAYLLSGMPPVSRGELAEQLQEEFHTTVRIADFQAQSPGTLGVIFGQSIAQADLDSYLAGQGYDGVVSRETTLDSFLVRVGEQSQATDQAGSTVTSQTEIRNLLESEFGGTDFLNFDSISQEVTGERVRDTGYAVAVAAVAVLLYIAWAFRRLAKSVRFGVSAIVALAHDVLLLLAVFAVFKLEVNSFFIIAVLTVIGYGVNNIIVVFDRIRENRSRDPGMPFDTIVNMSITESLTRTVNTSLTTLLVLVALLLFGGSTIQTFVLALTIGVAASLYSSLFIAPQLLVSWEYGELGRLFSWIPIRRQQPS